MLSSLLKLRSKKRRQDHPSSAFYNTLILWKVSTKMKGSLIVMIGFPGLSTFFQPVWVYLLIYSLPSSLQKRCFFFLLLSELLFFYIIIIPCSPSLPIINYRNQFSLKTNGIRGYNRLRALFLSSKRSFLDNINYVLAFRVFWCALKRKQLGEIPSGE